MSICSLCCGSNLQKSSGTELYKYKGKSLEVLEHFLVCSDCGEETVTYEIEKENEARLADAKREADGLLTSVQIKCIRKSLGLTQQGAGEVFGGGKNAFSKYERGDVIQSSAMDRLIRLAAISTDAFEILANIDDYKLQFVVDGSVKVNSNVKNIEIDDLNKEIGETLKVVNRKSTVIDFSEASNKIKRYRSLKVQAVANGDAEYAM